MLTLRALLRGRIPLSGGDSETSRPTSRSYRLPPPRPKRSGSLRKKSMPHVPGFLFLHQRSHNFAGPQSWGSGPPQLHEKEAHPEEIQGSWWRRSRSFPTFLNCHRHVFFAVDLIERVDVSWARINHNQFCSSHFFSATCSLISDSLQC